MDSVPFTRAKAQLSEIVDRVEREHQRLAVTRHGKTAAVLINSDDLASLEETVEIMRDPDLMASIHTSRREAQSGDTTPLEREP